MRTFIKIAFLVFLSTIFESCFWGDDGKKENIIGPFYTYINRDYNRSIMYSKSGVGMDIIEPHIVKVGNNERFIIAERIYYFIGFKKEPVYDSVYYYILDTHSKKIAKIIGPLKEGDFITKKKELGINNLEFTKVYKD